MQDAHELNDHIADIRYYLDNYTTIGAVTRIEPTNFY